MDVLAQIEPVSVHIEPLPMHVQYDYEGNEVHY